MKCQKLLPFPGGAFASLKSNQCQGIHASGAELFQRRKAQTDAENLHGLVQLAELGIGGRDADIGVIHVQAIGVSSSGTGHNNACLLAQGQSPFGKAGLGKHGHEVAALGLFPAGYTQRRYALIQMAQNAFKKRRENSGVLFHYLKSMLLILEILHMPELIELIVADGADCKALDGSIALAKHMGVSDDEILDSYEKIVSFFLD